MTTITKIILFVFLINILLISKSYSINTSATSAYILDSSSNTVLFEKNSDLTYGPASMSKLMLLYIVFERLQNRSISLEQEFLVSKKAWKFGGSKMFVNIGDKVSIMDLLKGVIVQSGNDACIVLAEGISGSEKNMVEEMNDKGQELGLSNSNFQNVTGWPHKDHYMSAKDIGNLAKAIIDRFPEYYQLFALTEFEYNDIKQFNRNELLNFDGFDGLKTGRTTQAGFGLVSSSIRNNRRIVSVVNGLNSNKARVNETKKLVNWGFREFRNFDLFGPEDTVIKAKVWLGNKPFAPLVTQENLIITIKSKNVDKLKIKAVYNGPLEVPIRKGDELGELIISDGEIEIIKPLFAYDDVKTINRFSRSFSIINYLLYGVSSIE